jgi:hypothetical protein
MSMVRWACRWRVASRTPFREPSTPEVWPFPGPGITGAIVPVPGVTGLPETVSPARPVKPVPGEPTFGGGRGPVVGIPGVPVPGFPTPGPPGCIDSNCKLLPSMTISNACARSIRASWPAALSRTRTGVVDFCPGLEFWVASPALPTGNWASTSLAWLNNNPNAASEPIQAALVMSIVSLDRIAFLPV